MSTPGAGRRDSEREPASVAIVVVGTSAPKGKFHQTNVRREQNIGQLCALTNNFFDSHSESLFEYELYFLVVGGEAFTLRLALD